MFPLVSPPAMLLFAVLLQHSPYHPQLGLGSRHKKNCVNTHKRINPLLKRLDPKASTSGKRDTEMPARDLGYIAQQKKS